MKITVAGKIGTLILIALAGTVALTGLMWTQVNNVYDAADFANINTVPSIHDLDTGYGAATELREELWQDIAQTDAAAQTALEGQMESYQKQAADALAKYEKEDMDEPQSLFVSDKADLDADRAALAQFGDLKNQALTLLHQGKQNDARDLLMANRVIPEKIATSFEAHRKLNMDYAAKAAVDAAATRVTALTLFTSVAALTLLAVGGVGYFASRSIVRPLKQALDVADRVSAGDLSWQVASTSSDETGQVLMALQRMRQSLIATVSSVRESADSVALNSTSISQGNNDLSARSEQAAASLEEAAASMEQMTATLKTSSDTAAQAAHLAGSARTAAAKGDKVVGEVVEMMASMTVASKKISEIIGVIDGIAFQTNILALNAAVEAARAGEQGRGFAVVASEVRSLAQRSANAAKEIANLINDSVTKIELGSVLVNSAGQAMNDIVAQVARVTDLVAEISESTKEQSIGVGQVNTAVTHVDQMTQQNASLVQESAAAAENLKELALKLVQSVSVFNFGDAPRRQHSSAHA